MRTKSWTRYAEKPAWQKFCVSAIRQTQEYRICNGHDRGLFPFLTGFPGGWDGMRAACCVNAVPPPGNSKGRGSARAAVGKEELQLAEHQVPVLAPGMPVLYDPLGCQVKHSPQRIVVGKAGFVLGDLPELPVQALNDVGRVYDFPDFRRVFKERAQDFPVVLPAFDAGGILLAPGVREAA